MASMKSTILAGLFATLMGSAMLVIAGIVYFAVTLWIVKLASRLVLGAVPDPNWAVLAAAILSVGAIASGSRTRF
ncbi:MAG: hypothetical protein ABIH41_00515 [Nanoarchaeota archaeon]